MANIALYLDTCCLNRPFDDQSQERVRLESEAVLLILSRVQRGDVNWISSTVLTTEIKQDPDEARREKVLALASYADTTLSLSPQDEARAAVLEALGFDFVDALHLAVAEAAGATLLSTDDKFVKRAQQNRQQLHTALSNPLLWLEENL